MTPALWVALFPKVTETSGIWMFCPTGSGGRCYGKGALPLSRALPSLRKHLQRLPKAAHAISEWP